jgi:secreted PhoX family phosphatase
MAEFNRREFLEFIGCATALVGASAFLDGCVSGGAKKAVATGPLPFTPLKPTGADTLSLAEGFSYEVMLKWRDPLNQKGALFGYNNDYLAYFPLDPAQPLEGLLWVNHEYHDPYFNSGWRPGSPRTKEQMHIERKEVGGSIVHIKKADGHWQMVPNSKYNRRLDAYTPIPLISERPIVGLRTAIGTFANCAGGVTPWGTVLTCEENYDNMVGEVVFGPKGERKIVDGDSYLMWSRELKLPPEHYGWVVEVNPRTGQAKKLCSMGRFAHECATTTVAPDGRVVVYMADDTDNEHVYKFISRKAGSLEEGELYVAETRLGRWLPLSRRQDPRLKAAFRDHTEMMIRTREAAKIVGATPLDRPEDIEIHPKNGNVFIALTNNKKAGNNYGSILKIVERDSNPLSLEFSANTFLVGGEYNGFACPDNLTFDRNGNLWMCTDISGTGLQTEPYTAFGNNGVFFIPTSGDNAGRVFQVASAPNGAEFTGPCFAPDGETLFLSVQHPGERAHTRAACKSSWPEGGDSVPKPCVVAVKIPASLTPA